MALDLEEIFRSRDFVALRDKLAGLRPSELATMIGDSEPHEQVILFRVLPRKLAAATFEYLPLEKQQSLLSAMGQSEAAAILNEMSPDDRTMLLEELPAEVTKELLTMLPAEERAVAVTLLGYPENSVGRLMTPDYVAVRPEWTIRYVLDYIREHGADSETLSNIYVVDEHGVLIDDLRIRVFLLAPLHQSVRDVMDYRFVALKATDDQETAVGVFRREDRTALPVTDTTGVLIGIVTIDDVLDVAEVEATEDIQKIGGMEALDEPYMRIALGRMVRKRAGWLVVLFLGEMLTATAMGYFEDEIARAVVLALFVPLIISSGGNAGSQATSLIIRALAVRDISLTDWWRVMRREIFAGFALGCVLAAIALVRILLWPHKEQVYGPHYALVAATVACSLIGVVLFGSIAGSMLPFALRRLGFDPAAASAPFVATLVDVTGLVIYFSIAYRILHGTLL